jgi:adhesin transport system membrane fusion protein
MLQKIKTIAREKILPETSQASNNVPAADIELMQDSAAALFQETPRFGSYILYGLIAFLVIFFIWAFFAEIDEVTVGEGKVIPSSQVQVIQNLEGGIISSIPVKVGDLVKKGDIIVRLDETRFSSSLGETRAKRDALLAKVARLNAEATGRPIQLPEELLKSNPQVAEDERQLYLSRQREMETSVSVLKQQASQRRQELQETQAKLKQLEQSYSLIDKELKISRPLAQQGVMSEVEILRLERQLSDLKGDMDATRLSLPRLEQAAIEANTKVEAAWAKFRSDAASEASIASAELAGTSASNIAAEDRLARTSVRSPVTGIVKQIKINTIGGVLQPGMEIMEVVPIEDTFLIETKVRPSDVGFIHPGQEAMVKLTAYDFSIYGGLEANVENISADTITEDKNGKSESYYLVQVRTKSGTFTGTHKKLPIIPGMVSTVHIKTGKKTILQYLMKPVLKAKYDALRER